MGNKYLPADPSSLTGLNNGEEIRVDRVGREAEYIENPALTIGMAVQPAVLSDLTSRPEFKGKGLIARFIYAVPYSTIGNRIIDPPPVPEHEIAPGMTEFEITLGGDQKASLGSEMIKVQGKILEKACNKEGYPVKFPIPQQEDMHVVAVDIRNFDGDKWDYLQIAYGPLFTCFLQVNLLSKIH